MECRNCGYELSDADRYCPACGQGVAEGRDRSFKHLLRSSFAEVSSVDSRLWRSIGALMFVPGQLSRAFREGRRRHYLSPIGVFLLANLLFFLVPPTTDFQLTLSQQYELQPYRGLITGWVDSYVAESEQTFDEVARRYELRIAELAKIMVILHVPMLALITFLLFRDRGLYYADHVVLGLHYFAFIMTYLISANAFLGIAYWIAPDFVTGILPLVVPILLAVLFAYVPPMLRRAFDLTWWRALLSTPLFALGFVIAHMTYRFMQFAIGFSLVKLVGSE